MNAARRAPSGRRGARAGRAGAETAIAVLLCACETNGPAASKGPAPQEPSATDWSGAREPGPAASQSTPTAGPSTQGTWVLHVGDSFVESSFAQNLAPRFRAAGARQVAFGKTATYTTTWASDPDLDRWLGRRPSLVLVTLGANEVDNTVPELHAGAIHAMARKIGAVAPCVWVAPPLWKPDTPGWLQVIHDHCGPCLFFDSDALLGGLTADERRPDRIHPNERGGARWAAALWDWLEAHRNPANGPWSLVPYEHREP